MNEFLDTVKPGKLFFLKAGRLANKIGEHPILCLTNVEGESFFALIVSSQVTKMMGRFEKWALQESSLVILQPSSINMLWKECAVECGKIRFFSKLAIAEILESNGFEELGTLEADFFEQVIKGILADKSVEPVYKEKMPAPDCLYDD